MSRSDASLSWVIRSGSDLGLVISDLRSVQGLTQAQLAAQVGLTRDYLAKIETGRSVSLLEHTLRALRRMGATVTVTYEPPDAAP